MDSGDLCGLMEDTVLSNPINRFCRMHSVNIEVAKHFLEMAGGNIKTASKLYKDSPPPVVNILYEYNPLTWEEIKPMTIPTVPPNSYVKKSWWIENGGKQCWPLQCKLGLVCVQGMDKIKFEIPNVLPGQVGSLNLSFFSTKIPGIHNFDLRVVTADNKYFNGGNMLQGAFRVDLTLDGFDEIAETLENSFCIPFL